MENLWKSFNNILWTTDDSAIGRIEICGDPDSSNWRKKPQKESPGATFLDKLTAAPALARMWAPLPRVLLASWVTAAHGVTNVLRVCMLHIYWMPFTLSGTICCCLYSVCWVNETIMQIEWNRAQSGHTSFFIIIKENTGNYSLCYGSGLD